MTNQALDISLWAIIFTSAGVKLPLVVEGVNAHNCLHGFGNYNAPLTLYVQLPFGTPFLNRHARTDKSYYLYQNY